MSITKRNPNTIYLGGGDGPGGESGCTQDNQYVAFATIMPGDLIERYNDGGTLKWRRHATADGPVEPIFALEQLLLNKTVDYPYAAGDLVQAGMMHNHAGVWATIPSGQNIAIGARLQSNGDGKLKALGAGVHIATAEESSGGVVSVDTRIRVSVAR